MAKLTCGYYCIIDFILTLGHVDCLFMFNPLKTVGRAEIQAGAYCIGNPPDLSGLWPEPVGP